MEAFVGYSNLPTRALAALGLGTPIPPSRAVALATLVDTMMLTVTLSGDPGSLSPSHRFGSQLQVSEPSLTLGSKFMYTKRLVYMGLQRYTLCKPKHVSLYTKCKNSDALHTKCKLGVNKLQLRSITHRVPAAASAPQHTTHAEGLRRASSSRSRSA